MQSLVVSALRHMGVVSPVPALWRPAARSTLLDVVKAAAPSSHILGQPQSQLGRAIAALPRSENLTPTSAMLDLSQLTSGLGLTDVLFKDLQPLLNTAGRLSSMKRLLLLLPPHSHDASSAPETHHTALASFTRSLAKEMARSGIAVNAIVSRSDNDIALPLALFTLSPACSYVTGQTFHVTSTTGAAPSSEGDVFQTFSLAGRTIAVTGAARGIGAAIAAVLVNNGAHAIGIDQPAMSAQLRAATHLRGVVEADITRSEEACKALQACLKEQRVNGLDGIVHNAGITRDKLLRGMKREAFDSVLDVNLHAPMRMNAALTSMQLLSTAAARVHLSSINGIAGAAGQTNYSTSKAGLIQYTRQLHDAGVRAHAVAPGFIATDMTAAMPFFPRLMAAQMCAFAQPGTPDDVAHMVAFMLSPAGSSLSGGCVRVCGGHFVGA